MGQLLVDAPAEDVAPVEQDEQQQFTATGYDQEGNSFPISNVVWSVGNTNIGTINENGLFTAENLGNTRVTAASGSISGFARSSNLPNN